jgi:hypothetical protein
MRKIIRERERKGKEERKKERKKERGVNGRDVLKMKPILLLLPADRTN